MSTSTFKQQLQEVSHGRPGHRFQQYHRRSKEDRQSGAAMGRIVRIGLAVLLFAVGAVFAFIPGPAILFFFLGGALLASESLVVARAMDWLEVRVRAIWRWARKRWGKLSRGGRIAVVLAAACLGGAVLWGGWVLLRH